MQLRLLELYHIESAFAEESVAVTYLIDEKVNAANVIVVTVTSAPTSLLKGLLTCTPDLSQSIFLLFASCSWDSLCFP